MATMFEQALRTSFTQEDEDFGFLDYKKFGSRAPSYVVASDTLSVANGNEDFLTSVSNTVDNIQKFIGVSVVSGANQLYNIPASVGNMFGMENELSKTEDVLTALDSDYAAFYSERKESADLAGFLISSLIPGSAGVKVFNAGQRALQGAMKGRAGSNISKAMGLLVPPRKELVANAIKQVQAGTAPATIANKNALKAVAAGFGQGALEATAFETAVAVTMQDSPVLENQDFGDFVSNIAWGAGVFGGIFSAVDAAKISSQLKKAATVADLNARPWTHRKAAADISKPYEKIAIYAEDYHTTPPLPPETDIDRLSFLRSAFQDKTMAIRNDIRTQFGELAKKDNQVAEVMFNSFIGRNREEKLQNVMGLVGTSRLGVRTKQVQEIEALQKEIQEGLTDLENLSPQMLEFLNADIYVSYLKVYGDDIGEVYKDVGAPVVTRNIDRAGEDGIKVTSGGVRVSNRESYPFSVQGNIGRKAGDPGISMWDMKGKSKWELDARYEWAAHIEDLLPRIKKGKKLAIHEDDIPLMEKLYFETGEQGAGILNVENIRIVGDRDGKRVDVTDIVRATGLQEFISQRKLTNANRLAAEVTSHRTAKYKQEEIASMVNMRNETLSGVVENSAVSTFTDRDLFARTSYAEDYTNMLKQSGVLKPDAEVVSLTDVPQHIRMVSDITNLPFEKLTNNWVKAVDYLKSKQKIYQDGLNRASASPAVLGQWYEQIPDVTPEIVRNQALITGAGPGLLASATDNYGTLAALAEQTGKVVANAGQAAREQTADLFNPSAYAILQKPEAAIEFSVLNNRLQQFPTEFVLDEAGSQLVAGPLKQYMDDIVAGLPDVPRPELPAGVPETIPIQNAETLNLAKMHIYRNAQKVLGHVQLNNARGVEMRRNPDAWYPVPVNPKRYPHFAFVIDDSITGAGHSKMLYATSEAELTAAVNNLKGLAENPQLRVLYKKQAEDYYRAHGRWEYEKTINKNYLDSSQQRTGTGASAAVQTNPEHIVRDLIDWHKDRDVGLIREGVIAKNEVAYTELKMLGEQFTAAGTSKTTDFSLASYAEEAVKNPFADYIKTSLAVRNNQEYPWWVATNRMTDEAYSRVISTATSMIEKAKTPAEIDQVNEMLTKAGYKGAAYDESMEIFANARPRQGLLTSTVQKANSILATVVLRWDALNAITNAVSANVLLGGELKFVQRAVARGDEAAAGKLIGLTSIKIPGATDGAGMLAPLKLVASSIKKLNAEGMTGPSMEFYKRNGYMPSMASQYVDTLEGLTYNGDLSAWSKGVQNVQENLRVAADKGEKWTGNKMAEEFNRFIAADVMKQITDVAVENGLMGTKEQLAYINTFVNRTQANYLASQRPLLFQGPVGQAIGLFQTYQFNLMQQLLRHVGEGHSKDAMTILGLQGTIHGMNGLPAFNAINTHVVGTASGNTAHRDAYDATYGIVGKEAGDWLMYGSASNLLGMLHPDLKLNLYTRGDLNPRHLTIIPTSAADIPFIQATSKFFTNIYQTGKKLAIGGNRPNILLQGLEHNAISRPLAGIAQTVQGFTNANYTSYSTSRRGNVIAANDMLSLTSLARMAGGKPLQEAIALDATYRFKAYGIKEARKRDILGRAIKSTMLAGGTPTQEQLEQFSADYVAAGGRQKEFSNWIGQLYKTANNSQANKISQSLTSPFTTAMQRLMGGQELRDFSTTSVR